MDFTTAGLIKSRLFVRPLISAIVPITIYNFGFFVLTVLNKTLPDPLVPDLTYFNLPAIATLLAICYIYPLTYVSLYCLFTPVEK